MSMGVLRGRDEVKLERVATIAEANAAVAISRGGAAKTYAYLDANEDCAGFARGPGGLLLAVGDAHNGCDASETAVETLVAKFGGAWTGATPPAADWAELARGAAAAAHTAVLARSVESGNPDSRSTLAFALLRPAEKLAAWASIGDSHVFGVHDAAAEELARGRDGPSWFLGAAQRTPQEMAERLRVGSSGNGDLVALVLATDGLSEKNIGVEDPAAAVAQAANLARTEPPHLRPLTLARTLVELAQTAHQQNRAGDNIAVATAWLPPT